MNVAGRELRELERVDRVLVFGASVLALVCLVHPPDGFRYRPGQARVYGLETWWSAGLFVCSGAAVALAPRAWRRIASVAAGACGLVVAGTGVVAYRRWFTAGGVGTHATNEASLRVLAVLVASCGVVAVGGAVVDLARSARRRDDLGLDAALLALLGAVVSVVVPMAMGWTNGSGTTQAGSHWLMYGLPWGATLAGSAFLGRPQRWVAAAVVAATAAPLLVTEALVPTRHTELGAAMAIAAAITAIVIDLVRPSVRPTVARAA
jgi:hypothetical protein